MQISRDALFVGRVFLDTDDFCTIEVAKTQEATFHLEANDRFLTLLFVHQTQDADGNPVLEIWDPFEAGA